MKLDTRNPFAAWGFEQEVYGVEADEANGIIEYVEEDNKGFVNETVVDDACGGFTAAAGTEGQNRALECAGKYLQTDIHMVEDADFIDPSTVIYAKKRNVDFFCNN